MDRFITRPIGYTLFSLSMLLMGCDIARNTSEHSDLKIPPELKVIGLNITPASNSIPVGLTKSLKSEVILSDGSVFDVTDSDVLNWSTSDAQIATVGNSGQDKGRVTGVAPGEITVTASGKANGQFFTASVKVSISSAVVTALQVTPARVSLPVGLKQQLKAEVTLSDGSVFDVTDNDALSWSGSNAQIATVGNSGQDKGRVTGVAPGEMTVTASGKANGQSFSASVKVSISSAVVTALQVTPARVSLPVGLKQQLKAEVTLSDGSVFDVTDSDVLNWSTSNVQIATVGNSGQDKGRVTGVAPGEMTVTASGKANGQSFSASVKVSISSAVVTALQVTPARVSLPV
ncbi:phage baseplate assembly protein W, partial [Aeromonas hydrophila]|uniref:Ig-like domain-containing protein n=1 Tax=Aeromonas hydrophila TaxID=644 RepID=UPI00216A67F4